MQYLLLLDAQYVIVQPGTGVLTLGLQALQVHIVPLLLVQCLDLDVHVFQAVLESLFQLATVLVTGLPYDLKLLHVTKQLICQSCWTHTTAGF